MSLKLVDPEDESYCSKHNDILQRIHDFINSKRVLRLDKMMISGIIDVPEPDDGRITYKNRIEAVSPEILKITMGQINPDGNINGVARIITIEFRCKILLP